jgi:thiol-disulfide isomerase/thioredoxin
LLGFGALRSAALSPAFIAMALLAARLALAAVFAFAGVGKLLDRAGARQAVIGFGVTPTLATPIALGLPVVELALAALLLPATSAWFASLGALTLLLILLAAIGFNLARGRRPDCHCFGQLHSEPIGPSTVIWNLALCGLAGVILALGRAGADPSLLAWTRGMTTAERAGLGIEAIGLAGVVLLSALMWQMLLQQGRILLSLERMEAVISGGAIPQGAESAPLELGLAVGERAPDFAATTLDGAAVTLASLLEARRPLALLFVSSGCGPCEALTPEIEAWREAANKMTIAVLTDKSDDPHATRLMVRDKHPVLVDATRAVAEAYQAWGTPSAVLVSPDGTIASRVAPGADAIRRLMADAGAGGGGAEEPLKIVHRGARRTPSEIPPIDGAHLGGAAPALRLATPDGDIVDLAKGRGSKTLVLFWNPGCGYCQQMLPELQAWDAARGENAPELLVISSGAPEEGRAMKLRSPVLMDPDFQAGRLFGATGTPMAVLLDEVGSIASGLVGGKDAVLALATAAARS